MARRHNNTGRSKTEQFLRIPHYLIYSVAWRELSPVARASFIEIAALYNGSNNGRLAVSTRALGQRLKRTKSTAATALRELEDSGFIVSKKFGRFTLRNRKASEYALTLHYDDVSCTKASREFMHRGMIPRSNLQDRTVQLAGHAKENISAGFN